MPLKTRGRVDEIADSGILLVDFQEIVSGLILSVPEARICGF
jgi:hypothetical protein